MAKYSQKEVTEILKVAADLGVSEIRLEGLEVIFSDKNTEKKTPNMHQNTPLLGADLSKKSGGFCDNHKENFIEGQYGPYCRTCYLERKEKTFKENGNW